MRDSHGEPAGYIFNAELYCPAHIADALPTGDGDAYDGWAVAAGIEITAEENLDEIAIAFGIDRDDEATFDSSEFPKVIRHGQLGGECGACGAPVGE
ncbi:hypothetical protein [Arthrobacter sp. A2-55]|uniref:hypothetical protein n=1 Tax=Arthrobacter sp. A2-55 TaxID=2897337 RepID=UPI0021CD9A9C|nr:hypothetical protein [Arthrobacter sp. A2-55]MCU6479008.1 hypothetical protein [Arthrobacter sp. A2-55]